MDKTQRTIVTSFLNLPGKQQLLWKNYSTPGKVFLFLALILFVLNFGIQLSISKKLSTVGQKSKHWTRFVIGTLIIIAAAAMSLIIVNVLYYTDWKIISWIVALTPLMSMFGVFILFNIISAVFQATNTSGGTFTVAKNFISSKKKL